MRGATALHRGAGRCKSDFNPRAPCGARRPSSPATAAVIRTFQPTRPLRGATVYGVRWLALEHAFQPTRPLRGATEIIGGDVHGRRNFNPRAPCGARRTLIVISKPCPVFQPTRPLRGATRPRRKRSSKSLFQPTRPLRGATAAAGWAGGGVMISTHAPLAGRDPSPSP